MKNKAFTLVELLGVIVILGILGVVIIPRIGDSLKNSKEAALKTQKEQIKKATYDFLTENTELLEENDTITVKLGVLKQKGYLPVSIKNPTNKKNISNESTISITKNENKYEISLNLIDLENVTENIDSNSPILILNGNYIEYVEVNTPYEELGATATTSSGQTINTNNISIQVLYNNEETTLVTNQIKTYSVVYSVTDSNGKSTSATRTVIVRDSIPPTIKLPKETVLHISEVANFNQEEDVVVSDNFDDNPTVNINSALADLKGNYVITYTATDSSGNVTTERRVINVNDDFNKYYTNLEYIESTGTQYINLDYKAKTTTEIRLDIQFMENQNTNVKSDSITQKILGSDLYTSTANFDFNFGKEISQKYTIFYWVNRIYDGSNSRSQVYTNIINRSTMVVKSGSATFQGVTTTLDTKENDNTTSNMLLLGTGTNGATFNRYDTKIYGFQIYEENNLIRNMIPCLRKSDNKAGLYDLVNNKFYTSSGSADFDYKIQKENPFERKYTRLNYIGTTGTQYINLEYNAKTNTEIRLDIQFIENENASISDDSIKYKVIGQKTYTGEQFNINFSASNNKQLIYWVNKAYDGTNSRYQTYTNITNRSTMIVKSGSATFQGITTTLDTKESDNTAGMLLLGHTIGNAFNKYDTKVYGFQIYEGNTLIKNMIPAVRNSDNKPGLYDTINDVFYTNSGTGEFTKGELQ